VAGGASFLGTFDREAAVADESLDFFAAGHPLVEGLLAHLQESPMGRVCLLGLEASEPALGLLALYRDGPGLQAVAVDETGRSRPEWAAALTRRPLRTRRVRGEDTRDPGWPARIRRLAAALDPRRQPVALAAVLAGP
jgi:ATP-dependent helicase HepA